MSKERGGNGRMWKDWMGPLDGRWGGNERCFLQPEALACGSRSPQESQVIEGLLSHPKSIPSVIPNLSSHPTPHSGPRKDT